MRIVWTAQGNKRLEHIFACCSDFYSQKQLRELNNRLKSAERLLADNPLLGALEPIGEGLDMEYRHIVLNKPFKLIYFLYEDCIYIADIWDTRQSDAVHLSTL